MKKPLVIAVEGADKAGKHTQVMKICEYLTSLGIANETLDFPQYKSFFGRVVKDYLNGNFGGVQDLPAEYKMMPYALDRLQHQNKIKEWLDSGKWVVFDRYTYSNSFSVAQNPEHLWDSKIKYMEELEFNQLNLIRPNHNFYLYLDPKIAFAMKDQGQKEYQNGKADIHERNYDLLYNVSKVYRKIANENPKEWDIIDEMLPNGGRMNPDEVFEILRKRIDILIQKQYS